MQPRPGADAEQAPISGMATPYPASWIDHLIAWIGRLPGPAWVFYVLAIVLLILVSHGVRWLDGSLPRGEFDPARVAEAPLILYFLALMHSLNSVARRSLDAFRPALAISEPQVARLEYELTTMPRAAGYISAAVGSVVGILSILSSPASWGISVGTSPLTLGYTVVASAVSMAFAAAFVFHTLRQLRLVSRIHRMATNINLFEKMPVYAFSALTARTGIGIVIIIYYYVYLFYFLSLRADVPRLTDRQPHNSGFPSPSSRLVRLAAQRHAPSAGGGKGPAGGRGRSAFRSRPQATSRAIG